MTEVTVIRAFLERDGDLERNKWGNYQSDSKQSITNRKMETVYVENAYLENTSVFFFFFSSWNPFCNKYVEYCLLRWNV